MLENTWDLLMVTAWLGLAHVAVAVFAVAVWYARSSSHSIVQGKYLVAPSVTARAMRMPHRG